MPRKALLPRRSERRQRAELIKGPLKVTVSYGNSQGGPVRELYSINLDQLPGRNRRVSGFHLFLSPAACCCSATGSPQTRKGEAASRSPSACGAAPRDPFVSIGRLPFFLGGWGGGQPRWASCSVRGRSPPAPSASPAPRGTSTPQAERRSRRGPSGVLASRASPGHAGGAGRQSAGAS